MTASQQQSYSSNAVDRARWREQLSMDDFKIACHSRDSSKFTCAVLCSGGLICTQAAVRSGFQVISSTSRLRRQVQLRQKRPAVALQEPTARKHRCVSGHQTRFVSLNPSDAFVQHRLIRSCGSQENVLHATEKRTALEGTTWTLRGV